MLLKDHFVTPRIVDKYREVDFKEAFTAFAYRLIDPEVRVLCSNWHMTLYQLMRFGLSVPYRSFRIVFLWSKIWGNNSSLVYKLHTSGECLGICSEYFWKMANHRLKITEELIRFNLAEKVFSKAPRKIKNMIREILNLAKYSIWCTRCAVKYDYRSFCDDSALMNFKRRLKWRIHVDFHKYGEKRGLFDTTWIYENVLCTVNITGDLRF